MREGWPGTTVRRTVAGKPVTITVRHLLANFDDPDVEYAYSPFGCSSAGPDFEAVLQRGYEKAQFMPISLDPDAHLRPLVRTLTALAPLATEPFQIEIGASRWSPGDSQTLGIQEVRAVATLRGKGWRATFTPDDEKPGERIAAVLRLGEWDAIEERLTVGPRPPDFKGWARKALARARKAARLQAQLAKLGVRTRDEEDD